MYEDCGAAADVLRNVEEQEETLTDAGIEVLRDLR